MLNESVEVILLVSYVLVDNRWVPDPKWYRARVVAVENDVPTLFEVVVDDTTYYLQKEQVEVID